MLFRLGRIPIRVRGAFLFMAVVLGARLERPELIAIWVAIVFVSVVAHELGHALVGRVFGLSPQVELHGMGGTTSWTNGRDVGHARGIAISVAGPLAGFVLAAALLLLKRGGLAPHHPLALLSIELGLQINLWWGVFNLVPMLPLDGGNVMRGTLHLLTGGRGEKPARIVSIAIGIALLGVAVLLGEIWLGALGAFFTWSNVQAYRQLDTASVDLPLAQAIQKAYEAVERQDGRAAIALLRPVMVPQTSQELRSIALRVYSYALLIEGMWDELLPTLEAHAALIGVEEMTRYEKTARELGREAEADRIAALVPRPRAANDFG